MRTFTIGFCFGSLIALAMELRAEEETLPLPIHTPDSTVLPTPRSTSKADLIKASRVERAKQVAAQRLAIETMNRWQGINPGRPLVNSGYMFLAPPRAAYRWFGPNQATYFYPDGIPLP